MRAIYEVLDITAPYTIGDEQEYLKLVAQNVLQVQIMIKAVLEREGQAGHDQLAWSLAYMREHAATAPEWHMPEYMRKLRDQDQSGAGS
jgi:hypothetical protein